MQKYQETVISALGRPVVGAAVRVTTLAGSAATIYSDNGITPIAALVTDATGAFGFYAADGRYTVTISGSGFPTRVISDVLLEDPDDGPLTAASLASSNGASLVGHAHALAPAYLQTVSDIINADPVQILRFIPKADHAAIRNRTGTTDHASNINDAITALYAAGGGSLLFPYGRYRNGTTLNWLPGVNLVGEGSKFNAASLIQGLVSLAGPVVLADAQVGDVVQTGLDGTSQRQLRAQMRGITITNAGTTLDCDAVRLRNTWFAEIKDSKLYARVGFGLRAYDCNGLQMRDVTAAASFFESLADSIIHGCDFSPADYPAVDGGIITPMVWFTTGSWKNIVSSSMIYNAPPGVAKTFTVTPASQSITCTGHGFSDSTPVILETTNTLPTALVSGAVVAYIKVIDANTVKLASSRANLSAGAYLTPSDAGSGTHSFRIGGKANLYLNGACGKGEFNGCRVDQGYWAGVSVRASSNILFNGGTVHENGRANAAGQAGFELVTTSDCQIVGTAIDGTSTVTATGTSNQTLGVNVVSGSRNVINTRPINHATANIQDAGTATFIL